MTFHLTIDGHEHTLELDSGTVRSGRFDGSPMQFDAVELAPGVFSLLLDGKSFVARAIRSRIPGEDADGIDRYRVQVDGVVYAVGLQDPRRWRRGGGAMAREGRQHITAPMPGKLVRLLVVKGQPVADGQGVVVVEAMKMQNEIKCRAAGKVQKVLAREGQAVAAGETLLIIE
jgi:biotin carboxyl carrier protein